MTRITGSNNFIFGHLAGENVAAENGCIVLGDDAQIIHGKDNLLVVRNSLGTLTVEMTEKESENLRHLLRRGQWSFTPFSPTEI